MTIEELKATVRAEIAARAAVLVEASRAIHGRPELAFEEHHAHDVLTGVLADAGVSVERGYLDVPTAFRATAGTSGPTIAVLLEYDALPEIGHACGHNVIAAAGLGAGLAAAAIAEAAGGRVVVLGTPAEEGGGGKIVLADRGAFEGIDAAMMVHPADADLCAMSTIAIEQLEMDYEGEAAHAAAAPWRGRNALDAAVLGYMNVAALRQHIAPDERVHGIFSHGGDKPNIVPKHASTFWYVRSPTVASLQPLKQRVLTALEAGAAATGCTCHHAWGERPTAYSDMRDNAAMLGAYVDNMATVGRQVVPATPARRVVGSTDMGNVSYLVPSIHPMVKVADEGVAIHTPSFATFAGGEAGDRAVIDGALAMALTMVDLWTRPGLLAAAASEFAGHSA